MGDAVGAQQCKQDVYETACPISCYGVVDHAPQSPLKLFYYGAFAVVVPMVKLWPCI